MQCGDLHRLFFVLESLDTVEYNEHYHAYRIEKPVIEDINISTQGELATFLPMHFTNPLNATGNYYVNVKYDVDLLNVH